MDWIVVEKLHTHKGQRRIPLSDIWHKNPLSIPIPFDFRKKIRIIPGIKHESFDTLFVCVLPLTSCTNKWWVLLSRSLMCVCVCGCVYTNTNMYYIALYVYLSNKSCGGTVWLTLFVFCRPVFGFAAVLRCNFLLLCWTLSPTASLPGKRFFSYIFIYYTYIILCWFLCWLVMCAMLVLFHFRI